MKHSSFIFIILSLFLLITPIYSWCLSTNIIQNGIINQVDYASDGSFFVIANNASKLVNIYNASSYQIIKSINNSAQPTGVKISKNMNYIAIVYKSDTVYFYNGFSPFNFNKTINANHGGTIAQLDFSQDSLSLLTCGGDSNAKIWTVSSGTTSRVQSLTNAGQALLCKLSSTNWISYSSLNGKFRLLDNSSSTPIVSYNSALVIDQFDFKYGTNTYVIASRDSCIRFNSTIIFNDTIGGVLNQLRTVNMGRAGKFWITGGKSQTLYIFNQTDNSNYASFSDFKNQITSMKLSNDEKTIITGDKSGEIRIYKTSCGVYECQSGEYRSNGVCVKCSSSSTLTNCVSCQSSTVCSICMAGYYLSGSVCKSCDTNLKNCLECQNSTSCLHCFDGFYLNSSNNQCNSCNTNLTGCVACNSSTVCIQCYRLDYFLNSSDNTCVKCSTASINCIKCQNSTICVECQLGFYVETAAGSRLGSCIQCPNNCLICQSSSNCTQCKLGYYSLSGTCTRCSTVGCVTCNNSDVCLECKQGRYLTSLNACTLCTIPCSTCSIAATNCTGCLQGYFYTSSSYTCTVCMVNCKSCNQTNRCLECFSGYKLDTSTSTCKQCSLSFNNCSQCTSTNCTKCYDSFYLNSASSCLTCISSISKCETCFNSTVCVECSSGYYNTGGTGSLACAQCPAGCIQCINSTVCVNCINTFFKNTSNICEPCKNNCLQCLDSTTCISCVPGYYFQSTNSTCRICQAIIPYCTTCKNNVTCASCYPGTYLKSTDKLCYLCSANCIICDQNNCLLCQIGYYQATVSSKKVCTLCPTQCSQCISLSNCSSCQSSYYLQTTTSKCIPCFSIHTDCLLCTQTVCLQCHPGYQLNKSLTNQNCSYCENFIPNCDICYWDETLATPDVKCNSCEYGYTLNLTTNLSCSNCNQIQGCVQCKSSTLCTKCETGYYLKLDNTCGKCLSKCASCSSSTNCIVCRLGYVYITSSTSCQICESKIQGCSTCFPYTTLLSTTQFYNCTFCQSGYYLQNFTCSLCSESISGCYICSNSSSCSLCLDKYYLQNTNSTCMKCQDSLSGCRLCKSPSICLSCENGYYLSINTTTYSLGDNKCYICSNKISGCLYCSNQTSCSQCYSGYFLTATYQCNFCESSIEGCLYCNDQTYCVQCRTGYYLNTTDNKCYKCSNEGCQVCLQKFPSQCASCNSKYYLITSNNSCNTCRSLVNFCQHCSPIECSQCQVGFYLENTTLCKKCSQTINGCSRCKTSTDCLQCMSSYFVNGSNLCQQCNLALLGCQHCINGNECLACATNYYLNSTEKACLPCTDQIGCLLCKDQTTCILCQGQYYLDSTNYQCFSCSSALQGCFSCVTDQICVQCQNGFKLDTSIYQCVVNSIQAKQSVGEQLKLVTYYLSPTMLKHVLYAKGMSYKKINSSVLNVTSNGKTKLAVQDFTGKPIDLTIIQYEFGQNEYTLIFYTDNPVNEDIKKKSKKMQLRRRMLEMTQEGMGSLELNFQVFLSMDQSVYNQILPELDYEGSMTVGYSLNNPQFYMSYMQSQQQTYNYSIIGIIIIILFILNYFLKIFFTVPQSKNKSGLLPHIIALKACCLITFPTFFEYISFCKGFMIIDLPWTNKILAENLVQINDIVVQPFGLFFNNMSLAGTYLLGLVVYIILKIGGNVHFSSSQQESKHPKTSSNKSSGQSDQMNSQDQVKPKKFQLKRVQMALGINYDNDQSQENVSLLYKKNYNEFIYSLFSFSIIYYSSLSIQGAFYNPSQIISINGVFYILGMLLMIYATIQIMYSFLRNLRLINQFRIYIKGILLSLGHLNPIYVISVVFTVDILLCLIQYLIIFKKSAQTKIIILNNILANISILIMIFMAQKLSSLILTTIFLTICFIIEVYIHVKQYKNKTVMVGQMDLHIGGIDFDSKGKNNEEIEENVIIGSKIDNDKNNINGKQTNIWDMTDVKLNPRKKDKKNKKNKQIQMFNTFENLDNSEIKQIKIDQFQPINQHQSVLDFKLQSPFQKVERRRNNRTDIKVKKKSQSFYNQININQNRARKSRNQANQPHQIFQKGNKNINFFNFGE